MPNDVYLNSDSVHVISKAGIDLYEKWLMVPHIYSVSIKLASHIQTSVF